MSGRKKKFPAGTFIPGPARICAIIQLCIAFSILLWEMAQPFTGELFRQKSNALLYEEVIDNPKFASLPQEQQSQILAHYDAVKIEKQRSFEAKVAAAADRMLFHGSVFKRSWLLFSIILPIFLLKRREGALAALWILPLLALCYAVDNQRSGTRFISQEAQLFPSEKEIVEKYVAGGLSPHIFEQQEQLRTGWKHYLVQEWLEERPSHDPQLFEQQAQEGAFAFALARLEKRQLDNARKARLPIQQEHPLILGIYLFWNVLFALVASLKMSFNACSPRP
jgi:hypothetical protein